MISPSTPAVPPARAVCRRRAGAREGRGALGIPAMAAFAVLSGLHAGGARSSPPAVSVSGPPGGAVSGPTGGSVVAGEGTIHQTGSTTTIDQQSPTLILDWQGFSISPSGTVQFVQPSTTSIALNRVIGDQPSQIYGHLLANGRVFLINPNGVLFGSGASVDVGGLVASSLGLSDSDFLSGNYRFQGSGSPASIVNQGTLTASDGGSVALLGGRVINQGVIRARLGTVALAAGSAMTLDFVGNHLLNVQISQGAAHALAANHQLIEADGGTVIMTAAARDALLQTVVNNDGVVEARTIQDQGGKIELLGSQNGGTVQVGGTLDASAPSGGNGGAIETSGATVKVSDGAQVTTAAPDGTTGTWLVDPTDFTIAPSGGDISGATLSTDLSSNNVNVSSTVGLTSGTGDIYVDDVVNWSANTTLTLSAVKDIEINSSMSASGNTAGLVLTYGSGDNYYLNYGSYVNLSGTTPSLTIGGIPYTVINSHSSGGGIGTGQLDSSGTTLQGIQASSSSLGGHYALGSNIDATATATWNDGNYGAPGFMSLGFTTPFTGVLAGLGHVINNLTTYPSQYDGLFAITSASSVIRDVGLSSGNVNAGSNSEVGALVGENHGTIIDSFASVSVAGTTYVGGLVGDNYGSISGSYASGSVTNSNNGTGGLVGYNAAGGSITNSYATGSVDGQNADVGGLVGVNAGAVSSSSASGAATSTNGTAGGLVGDNSGQVSGSHASGSVTAGAPTAGGAAVAGGLVGWNEPGAAIATSYYLSGTVNGGSFGDIGGLVGENSGSIDQSYASGTVSGSSSVGGLVGWQPLSTAKITNSYADGTVSGTTGNIGGLVGDNLGSIQYAYAAASVSGPGSHGFIGGTDGGTTTGSYWLQTGTIADTSAAVPLTAAQSQAGSSYAGWNFSSVWRIYGGHTMPLLKALLTPLTITTTNIYVPYVAAAWSTTGLSTPVYSIAGADTSGHLFGLASPYAGDINAGTYSPDLWSDQQGYDITVTPDSLHILPDSLEITTANVTKTYDGTTSAAGSAEVTGGTRLFGSDTISGGVFAFTNANVGAGDKTVTTSGVTVNDGNGGNNYTVTYVNNTTSTINPAPLDISTANVTKTYDGTTGAAGSLVLTGGTRLFGSDTLSGGVFAFTNANAGIGDKTVTTGGVTVSDGNGGNNYAVTYVDNTTSTINPAPLDISTANVTKTYDGTTSAAGSLVLTGGTRLFGSDTISGGAFAFTDPNAGVGDKTVTTSGVTVSDGNGGNNYAVTYVDNTTSTINKAALTLAAQSSTKTYDGTLASSGIVAVAGNVPGDAVSATEAYTSGDVQGAGGSTLKVTQYSITDAAGADMSGNYDVAATTAPGTIDPASITVSGITAQSKAYDGTTSATLDTSGAVLAGRISGDALGVSATGSFADPNAGMGKAVTLSLTLTGAASGNYVLAASDSETSATANISPDALTITAGDASRVAGQPNPPLTLSYSGFVAGQGPSSLTTLPTEWTTAGANSAAGTYPIDVSGAVDPNYVFTYVPGVLTVTDGGAAAQVASPSYVGVLASVGGSDGGIAPSGVVASADDSKSSSGIVCGPTADANCAKSPDGQGDAGTKALGTHFLAGLSLEIIADGMRLPPGVE
jgi:filamentous hemagglutinin family protein